jgi:flagellar biosynthesis protein FlhF
MQTKTYFANSVPAAFEVARHELGPEALFLRSAPAPVHFRHFGRFEVTFGWEPPGKPTSSRDRSQSQRSEGERDSSERSGNYQALKTVMAVRLSDIGFSRAMAADIASPASRMEGDPDAAVVDELARRIPVAAVPEWAPGERRSIAFVGPPGRGKTTSLVKIAILQGVAKRMPVRIFSAGAHPLGAREQMARYAAILGVKWQAYEVLSDLRAALNGDSGYGLTLIDTPGISPADGAAYRELAEFLTARPEIERQMVLRAEATSADMLTMVSRFSALTPARLLFTGLDEAASRAPMLETLIRTGIPIAYMGTGQQIPAHLEVANAERLARAAWAESAGIKQARAAA